MIFSLYTHDFNHPAMMSLSFSLASTTDGGSAGSLNLTRATDIYRSVTIIL